eukprot:TRINITY_DN9842_c0_g1_i1.p1 TRINITY_DN9842_c0_g1~~TRINITY_DN9842_c0_g1_i1.p1  ORF type:complete len:113 (+),score=10.05 TRINITY_DN9842_c0_g1_i1:3-341(+)
MTLAVDERFRKLGVGSSLLGHISTFVMDNRAESIYLHVKSDNTNAIKFYKNHGFATDKFLPNYYTINNERHDAYRLSKKTDWHAHDSHARPSFLGRVLRLCRGTDSDDDEEE